jgi:hypothetical protein
MQLYIAAQPVDVQSIITNLLSLSPFVGYLAYQAWACNAERVKQREEDQRRYDTLVEKLREGLIQSNVAASRISDILEAGRPPPRK